jgi:hypothetical protein
MAPSGGAAELDSVTPARIVGVLLALAAIGLVALPSLLASERDEALPVIELGPEEPRARDDNRGAQKRDRPRTKRSAQESRGAAGAAPASPAPSPTPPPQPVPEQSAPAPAPTAPTPVPSDDDDDEASDDGDDSGGGDD